MADKKYLVTGVYRTIHGEGVRFGIPHIFVRFAQCNLTCNFCDTEFESAGEYTAQELVDYVEKMADNADTDPKHKRAERTIEGAVRPPCTVESGGPIRCVMFCGGEPLLQLDHGLVDSFKTRGWFTVVETNGTRACPPNVDWITCSPKVAEHAIKLERANELKYVRGARQGIPRPKINADHYLISPLFDGTSVPKETLDHCIRLVVENPKWRLTVQDQKFDFGDMR